MTNRQKKIKERLDEMADKGYVQTEENENRTVKVYHANIGGTTMYTVIKPDSFKFYINKDYLKGTRYSPIVLYSQRQYISLETALDNIERNCLKRERNEERRQEYIRKREEKRNNPLTYKNEYFDQLLEDENYLCNRGECSVLRSYNEGRDFGFTKLAISDIDTWPDEIDEYKEVDEILAKGGVTEFLLTEKSTALMGHLDNLDKLGWKMAGMDHFSYQSNLNNVVNVTGIRMVKEV